MCEVLVVMAASPAHWETLGRLLVPLLGAWTQSALTSAVQVATHKTPGPSLRKCVFLFGNLWSRRGCILFPKTHAQIKRRNGRRYPVHATAQVFIAWHTTRPDLLVHDMFFVVRFSVMGRRKPYNIVILTVKLRSGKPKHWKKTHLHICFKRCA